MFAENIEQLDRTHVLWRGRALLYFGGCDYLRLSFHTGIRQAIKSALLEYGLNVAASRKTTGNHPLYEKAEKLIAKYFRAREAILTSSGYLANLVVAQALRGQIAHVFVDERAHSSLQDAADLLGTKITMFRHGDGADLQRKFLKTSGDVAILTDGLFAHNGSIADLKEYREIVGPKPLVWVDDAHGAGVLGKTGRGTGELCSISSRNLIRTITFSKAFGVYGGAVLCEGALAKKVLEKSRIVTGNTPLPLPLVNAIIKALEIDTSGLRRKLQNNIRTFYEALELAAPRQLSPIISFSAEEPVPIKKKLLQGSLYPGYVQYPGGPSEGYFRFAVSSAHSGEEISRLAALLKACKNYGLRRI